MNPITREESLLDGQDLTPITRKEQFIKRIYDKTQEIPEPITREEWFLKKAGEGTSPVAIEQLNVTENGTYSETGKAYSPVIVEVPAPTLITKTITENGTYTASEDNADGYSQVTVNVPYMEKKSASGDIASFSDGAGYPFLKVKANINPVQDLHGYDYPWVGGAGANKWDEEWSVETVSSEQRIVSKNPIKVISGETYYVKSPANTILYFNAVTSTGSYARYLGPVGGSTQTLVVPSDVEYVSFSIGGSYGTTYNNNIAINYPSTVTTYSPYSNICPISGFTGVNVAVTGKNLYDMSTAAINGDFYNPDGTITHNPDLKVSSLILLKAGTYTASWNDRGQPYIYVRINVLDSNKNFIKRLPSNYSSPQAIALSDDMYLQIVYDTTIAEIQIEKGSTATTYEAYNGHVYPISWQDEAGIVYGGYIDLVSGVLTVTKVGIAEYNGETLPSAWISDRDRYVAGNTPTIGAQVVYDLATPQTYNLTPQQINTLIGQNNVWNNTNGQTEVEYFIPIE